MSEVRTVPAVNKDSHEEEVAAYVGQRLQGYRHVLELQQFIIDQAIGGECFLTLTDHELESWGLTARRKREKNFSH